MLPTLAEVLTLPSFVAGSPRLLCGDPASITIRWVHSSEVFEMGGLLAGGEVLLTSGLGLEGRTDRELGTYVDRLADAGCAALAMEVGRSFFDVPRELAAAARRRNLCLIALDDVVPFERMVEDFHELLVRRRTGAGRGGDALWQELLGLVVADLGVATLLSTTARLAGCPVELRDVTGRLVAASAEVAPRPTAGFAVDVRSGAERMGRLSLLGERTQRRVAVADRAAVAVGLMLHRSTATGRPSPAQSLVTELAVGDLASSGEVRQRCAEAGWPVLPDRHLLAAAVDLDVRASPAAAERHVRDAAQTCFGPTLVGVHGTAVVVLARGWTGPDPARVRAAFEQVRMALAATGVGESVRVVAVAAPVHDPSGLAGAVAQSLRIAGIARRVGTRGRVVTAADVAAHRFLTDRAGAAELSAFASEVLGPLFEHDRQHATALLRTLDVHFACGRRKAASAARLGIRRQTLYDRLSRIEHLLGVGLDDPEVGTTLGMALIAWRLRTGLPVRE
ncbi:PucR family transcriptional regulator [Nakamurella flava]|uniref:PucR family transcriptional regulator n=1 Tax=Nakamurella flava TaxID=2576308 RepID=A0A4U6QJE1_9ACTN|nr:PucR family transcriptional regulator [Nakamurella flava]TKV60570.1 PucR family transcriptional regulator [Nakamurella flava]